ncbi:hypothetical protein Rs2_11241 [Raphanus sativus]|uniref:Uncharacterized protein LOC108846550 n=1 Tax=Raphanus sativus TaxID=3726 RepID=A0A6J0MTV4_RAPSA|nr:uncharacterized protein LOC108846550 [Raphanus sativus]XP_056856645.1 uncharacterized protein LOC130506056 [Raphanus sativus]KAJ4867355.1 hypothetical protein Rs2_51108 [Raphanus sativus]KAJ4907583.1 hypothetical protein Rs2_11241 [Raphanus sativus]
MSLLLNHPSKLCFRRPVLVRSSPRISDAFSPSFMQTPPCSIIKAVPCGGDLGRLEVVWDGPDPVNYLEKKVPMELMNESEVIGSSNGWVATLKDDGILRLQDDLNPCASDTDPKRIPLPPLVTLPHCQTKLVTNVSMSSSSPEDEDCVVAVKFLGPQLSFCRPTRSKYGWINVKIENSCFYNSHVMFSKKDQMFRVVGSGGHLVGSWDLHEYKHSPKLQKLRFRNLPKMSKAKRELMDMCCTTEYLVESESTGETFLVKRYRKTLPETTKEMKTEFLMVFNIDQKGNAVYTKDIGDLCIFLSKSEPFSVTASSFPVDLTANKIIFDDVDEFGVASLEDSTIHSENSTSSAPYQIPPQPIY